MSYLTKENAVVDSHRARGARWRENREGGEVEVRELYHHGGCSLFLCRYGRGLM